MQVQLDRIILWTEDSAGLLPFYRDVLGMTVAAQLGSYVEFEQPGARFAICNRTALVDLAGVAEFAEGRTGQQAQLGFRMASAEALDATYDRLVEHGASSIRAPEDMPWGERTALFADPEGNIHELFVPLPSREDALSAEASQHNGGTPT